MATSAIGPGTPPEPKTTNTSIVGVVTESGHSIPMQAIPPGGIAVDYTQGVQASEAVSPVVPLAAEQPATLRSLFDKLGKKGFVAAFNSLDRLSQMSRARRADESTPPEVLDLVNLAAFAVNEQNLDPLNLEIRLQEIVTSQKTPADRKGNHQLQIESIVGLLTKGAVDDTNNVNVIRKNKSAIAMMIIQRAVGEAKVSKSDEWVIKMMKALETLKSVTRTA